MTKEIKPIEIKKEVLPIVSKFKDRIIETSKQMSEAVAALSDLNKILDRLTEEKEKITKPLNAALKEVRGRYKNAETQLEEYIVDLRSKISGYQTEQVRLQRIEEEKIASRVGEGKGKLKFETAVAKIDELDKPAEEVITNAGMVKFKEVKKIEIVDKSKVPMDYLVADESAIRKAMIEGIELPGVRYYTEQVPVNYR